MKKYFLFSVSAVFLFLGCQVASASILVNEVAWMGTVESQYGEWIELYNSDSSALDLAGWKLYEGGGDTLIFTLTKTIPANGFLVIERTTASSPDPLPNIDDEAGPFGGSGLSNTGEFLVLKDASDATIDSLDFSSGWPAGNSETKETMQSDGSSWITGAPTPKEINVSSPPPSGGGGGGGGGGGSSGEDVVEEEVVAKKVVEQKIKTTIIANKLAYAGIPTMFLAGTTGKTGEKLYRGKYYWNFGDGVSFETNTGINEKFSHIFYYPGDYEVVLDYYPDSFTQDPDTINKILVKVVDAAISISRVGDEKDFFIEFSNNSNNDVDISNWILTSSNRSFTFPKNTNIKAKGKMILSPRVTNFSLQDKNYLKLFKSTNEIAFDYNSEPAKPILATTRNVNKGNAGLIKNNEVPKQEVLDENTVIEESFLDKNLSASGLLASENKEGKAGNSYLYFWSFVVLIILSVGVVYFIRKKGKNLEVGEDFAIIDE